MTGARYPAIKQHGETVSGLLAKHLLARREASA
jgi:hypothetical protein